MTSVLSPPDNIVWQTSKGVPVADSSKLDWIQKAIDYLKAHPDEWWTSTSSGDTYIRVERCDTYYVVEEYEPKRWAFINRDPGDISICSCDIATINQKGCQCGGI